MTSNQTEVSNVVSESSLVSLVNNDEMKHINGKIKSDCASFNDNFNDLEKSILSKSIYERYRQLLELGEIAVDAIEKMDEEIEFKDKKIIHLEDKLKDLNQYDEAKINEFLNNASKAIACPKGVSSVKRDRARRRLMEAMNNANKTFKQLGVKQIKFENRAEPSVLKKH